MVMPTETAGLSDAELTDSGLMAQEHAWDQTRPAGCGYSVSHWHRDQDLSLLLELASLSTSSLEGYLAQPRDRGEGRALVFP